MPGSPIAHSSQATLVVEWFQVAARFIDDSGFKLRGNNVPKPVHRSLKIAGRRTGLRDLARADVAGNDLEVAGLRSHRADDIQCFRRRL